MHLSPATLSGLRAVITCHRYKNEVYHTNNTSKQQKWNLVITFLQHIAEMSTAAKLVAIVMSSVTWPFDSPYDISYCLPFGTELLSLTVIAIFGSKHTGTRRIVIAHVRYHVTCAPYVKFKYILISYPSLPIQYVTFIGLRWRIMGVLQWRSHGGVWGYVPPTIWKYGSRN